MHVNTSEYNKEKLAPLSAHGSTPEETSNLLALYNMCSESSVPISLQEVETMMPSEVVL
jgi:hypothetical protein